MSYNKFQFIGNLTCDTELIEHTYGYERAILNIAVKEACVIGDVTQEKTEYFSITCLGIEVINAVACLSEGSLIFVEGRIESSSYKRVCCVDGADTNYAICFIATNVVHLDLEKFDLLGKPKYKSIEIVDDDKDW